MRLLWVVSKTQSQGQAYLFSKECCFGVRFGVLQKKKRLTVALAPAPAQFVHILAKLTLTLLSKLSAHLFLLMPILSLLKKALI